MRIDLNADVGESFGAWSLGEDDALIPHVTSVNIACGAHAGDPRTIERTVDLAIRHGVAIGAHPGYADLAGFGRRAMDVPPDELEASILYQVGAVAAFVRAAGATLTHVKAHGALYNRAARDPVVASAIARAVRRADPSVALVGLAGSALLEAGRDAGLPVLAEAFADRAYERDGSLREREHADSLLVDPEDTARQAVRLACDGRVTAVDGTDIPVVADTLCVHGDAPGAAARAAAVRRALEAAGIEVAAPRTGRG